MDNEHTLGIDHNAGAFEYDLGQTLFIGCFDVHKFFHEFFIVGKVFEFAQFGQLGYPAVVDFGSNQVW